MLVALISQSKGLALVDDGSKMHILSAARPERLETATAQRVQSFMDATDLEPLEVQDVTALVKHLRLRRTRERLLECVLTMMNGEIAADVREFAAQELTNSDHTSEYAWAEGVLLSAPLPDGADPIGAAAFETPFQQFFADLPAQQEKIQLLARAWELLPKDLFNGENSASARARAVRQGVFRALLKGERDAFTPFVPILARYAEELQQNVTLDGTDRHTQPDQHADKRSAYYLTFEQFVSPRPWKAAWLHSDWHRLESLFALSAAARLFNAASKLLITPTHDALVSAVRTCWDIERSSSSNAAAVNQISQLQYTILRKDQRGAPSAKSWHFFGFNPVKKCHCIYQSIVNPSNRTFRIFSKKIRIGQTPIYRSRWTYDCARQMR